jgi:protein SCO1/2
MITSQFSIRLKQFALFVFISALMAFVFSACQKPSAKQQASPDAKRYDLTGKVVAVDKANGQATIAHDEVKGYMTAMTMEFSIKDDWVLKELNPGDMISATLVVDKDGYWLEGIAISKSMPGGSNPDAANNSAAPEPGQTVPNFQLVNQDGKQITLDQYRGKYLVLTFIYTRCPLPDQCPLISNNFAIVHNELLANKTLGDKVHLLSVTIDPKYDTPKVMRSYGASRSGRFDKEDFKLWDFATGTENQIQQTAKFFGLYYVSEKDQIVHSLRAAIITPEGKVHKILRGNQWKPEEVVQELKTLTGAGQ